MLVYPRMLKNDDALQLGFHFQGDGAGKMKLKNNGSFFFFFFDFFFEGAKLPDALLPLSFFYT